MSKESVLKTETILTDFDIHSANVGENCLSARQPLVLSSTSLSLLTTLSLTVL